MPSPFPGWAFNEFSELYIHSTPHTPSRHILLPVSPSTVPKWSETRLESALCHCISSLLNCFLFYRTDNFRNKLHIFNKWECMGIGIFWLSRWFPILLQFSSSLDPSSNHKCLFRILLLTIFPKVRFCCLSVLLRWLRENFIRVIFWTSLITEEDSRLRKMEALSSKWPDHLGNFFLGQLSRLVIFLFATGFLSTQKRSIFKTCYVGDVGNPEFL